LSLLSVHYAIGFWFIAFDCLFALSYAASVVCCLWRASFWGRRLRRDGSDRRKLRGKLMD
jgi:hypothetical protein